MSMFINGVISKPIIQVVGATGTATICASTTWTATDLTVTITPKFSDSTFAIFLTGGNGDKDQGITLFRNNTTNLFNATTGYTLYPSRNAFIQTTDTPGLGLSPVTYTVYIRSILASPAYYVYWGYASTGSWPMMTTMVVMELGTGI